jgi:hypothetical protein
VKKRTFYVRLPPKGGREYTAQVWLDCDPLSVFEKIQRFGCGDIYTAKIPECFGFLKGGQPLPGICIGDTEIARRLGIGTASVYRVIGAA